VTDRGLRLGDRAALARRGLAGPGLRRYLDGVPWRPERRRVRKVQVADLVHPQVGEQRRRGDVDALGDRGLTVSDELVSQEPATVSVTRDAQRDRVAPG
jgi:hypothetical protein